MFRDKSLNFLLEEFKRHGFKSSISCCNQTSSRVVWQMKHMNSYENPKKNRKLNYVNILYTVFSFYYKVSISKRTPNSAAES